MICCSHGGSTEKYHNRSRDGKQRQVSDNTQPEPHTAAAAALALPVRPSVEKLPVLREELYVPRLWHDYLNALIESGKSVQQRRLEKLRTLLETIINTYTEEQRWDKVTQWKALRDGAESAITDGQPTEYDFSLAGLI